MSKRSVVVTGGAAGIGLACARRFAKDGDRVAVLDRDDRRAAEVTEALAAEGYEARAEHVDVTSATEVREVFDRIGHAWEGVDILVNGAGGFTSSNEIEDVSEEEWDKLLALNLKSAFLCSQQCIPHMKAVGFGRIVNISSLAGRTAVADTSLAYSAAKAGLIGFTRRLALDVARFGITVNAVAPGVVLSPRVAALHEQRLPAILAATPVGRVAESEEIASAIAFLASSEASYITGATLDVNGGRLTA